MATGYEGLALPNQVNKGLTSGFDLSALTSKYGSDFLSQIMPMLQQSGGIFSQMAGQMPGDITVDPLAGKDLTPYENPFTKSVIDSTINDLNAQEGLEQRKIADTAQDQNAFGGDRFAIQQAAMNKNFDKTRSDAISSLYKSNFDQAQTAAQGDITRKLQADTTNQGIKSDMVQSGASGLSGLSGIMGQLGTGLTGQGQSGISDSVGKGWQIYGDINQNNAASGDMQKQITDAIIAAFKGQYTGYTGAPSSGLETFMKGIGALPSGVGTTTQQTPSSKSPMSMIGTGLSTMGTGGMLK